MSAQLALDLGAAGVPIPKRSAFQQHLDAGLCGYNPYRPFCDEPATARPCISGDDWLGVDSYDPSGPWTGTGEVMCRQHASDAAEGWWWSMTLIAGTTDHYVTDGGDEWVNPAVWVEVMLV